MKYALNEQNIRPTTRLLVFHLFQKITRSCTLCPLVTSYYSKAILAKKGRSQAFPWEWDSRGME